MKTLTLLLVSVELVLISVELVLNGQTPPVAKESPAADLRPQTGAVTALAAQTLGPDDLLSISVADSLELTRTFRVGSDGMLALPLLSNSIRAAGLSPSRLEKEIANALRAQDILVTPTVTVSVVEYRSRPVSVIGAVNHPLTFQAIGGTNLLDALSRADGLSADAGSEILISKNQSVRRISVRGLIDQADGALNVPLEGGEEIRVPAAGKVFVTGNVRKPGVFPIHDNGQTTVLKALALSEGLLPFAGKTAYVYRTDPVQGNRVEIAVELSRIMDRKAADVAILPGDILYIPDNHGKRLAVNVLDRVAGFGTSAGSAAIVYRH